MNISSMRSWRPEGERGRYPSSGRWGCPMVRSPGMGMLESRRAWLVAWSIRIISSRSIRILAKIRTRTRTRAIQIRPSVPLPALVPVSFPFPIPQIILSLAQGPTRPAAAAAAHVLVLTNIPLSLSLRRQVRLVLLGMPERSIFRWTSSPPFVGRAMIRHVWRREGPPRHGGVDGTVSQRGVAWDRRRGTSRCGQQRFRAWSVRRRERSNGCGQARFERTHAIDEEEEGKVEKQRKMRRREQEDGASDF
jgi:hypothetical protein